MSLQIGDWVQIVQGCRDYAITVPESVGVVVSTHYEYVEVAFKEYGAGSDKAAWVGSRSDTFGIHVNHLGKIDPPAHLVGIRYADFLSSNETVAVPQPKTTEQIHEILGQKIDSEEKLLECMVEIGLSKNLFGTDWWKARDNIRTNHEYFKKLNAPSGAKAVPQDNYLHVSKCKTKVAFYENEDKQKRDICTVMGYGRYLTKYHPELDNEQVKAAVNTFNYDHGAAPEVFFGESQDEFIRAINEGPSESCMQGLDFAGHIHPAAVYAAGDIKVAWLEREGNITARALVNKQTKAFSRVYGDSAKLKPLLESMGYESKVGALAGCRLLMIKNKDGEGYIMPYVDAGVGTGGGALRFYEDGSYFMLSELKGTSTCVGNDNNGVTDAQGSEYSCEDCGCDVHEDDLNYTYHEHSVCDQCLSDNYTYALVGRGEHDYVRNRDVTYVKCMDEYVHSNYLDYLDIILDDFSGEYIYDGDAVKTLSDQWAKQDDCTDCGENARNETIWLHDTEVRDAAPGELYKNGDGEYFWHGSIEVVEWLESAGEEGHDPDEFVLVKEWRHEPVTEAPEPQATQKIKVGDMVKVLCSEGWGPEGHVGEVIETKGNGAAVETPGAPCVFVSGRGGWWHNVENLQLVTPAPGLQGRLEELQKIMAGSDINNEPQPTWQAAYLRMQERGIKFLHLNVFAGYRQFDGAQHHYKIDPTQTPPADWQEIYNEAQDSGVVFEFASCSGRWEEQGQFSFDAQFDKYRLKETA